MSLYLMAKKCLLHNNRIRNQGLYVCLQKDYEKYNTRWSKQLKIKFCLMVLVFLCDRTADFVNRRAEVIVKLSWHNFHKGSVTLFLTKTVWFILHIRMSGSISQAKNYLVISLTQNHRQRDASGPSLGGSWTKLNPAVTSNRNNFIVLLSYVTEAVCKSLEGGAKAENLLMSVQ